MQGNADILLSFQFGNWTEGVAAVFDVPIINIY